MRRIALVGALSLMLSGCADAQTGTPTAIRTTTPPTTSDPFEPLTTNPQDCYDGTCTIKVERDTAFPFDTAAFGLTGFVATTVNPDAFVCELYVHPQGAFTLTLKEPGQSAAGHLNIPTWVTLIELEPPTAVIAIGHTEPP